MSRSRHLFAPNTPFRPASLPFFYGWVIVAAGTGGMLCTLPGQTAGVSAFTEHLLAALEVSRVQLSAAYMVGTFAAGMLLPKVG